VTRLASNVDFGVLTDNPLTSGATVVNSSGFASLLTVAGSDDLLLTLDPGALYGDPEIIRVTAHTAAATSVTCVRGHDATTARAHQAGVQWVHSPYVEDRIFQCTSATRPSAPSVAPYIGMRIFETDTNRELRWNGSTWVSHLEPYAPDVGWMLYA
jgi:hypothetical protein